MVTLGTTAEDLVRHAAFLVLARTAFNDLWGPRDFPKMAKALGLDLKKILDAAAPAPKAAPGPAKPVVKGKKTKAS